MARRAVGTDGRIIFDQAAVEGVLLVDVTVVARGGPGVGHRGAPAAFLGERLLRRQQDLGRAGLDALLADDQAAEARHVAAPGLAQARVGAAAQARVIKELAGRVTVAQGEGEAVVAQRAGNGGIGQPLTDLVAHAEAELIRVRHLEVVVQQIDFQAGVAGRTDQGLQVADAVEQVRVPVIAGGLAVDAGAGGRVAEVDGRLRQGQLGGFQLQVVEQIAVIRTTGTTVEHVLLVGIDVIREAQARLPGILERLAVVAVADVVADVQAAQRQRIGVGLARGGARILRVDRVDHLLRGHEVQVGRGLLVVPTQAEVQLQMVVDLPVVLDEQADLLGLRTHFARHARHAGHRLDELRLVRNGRREVRITQAVGEGRIDLRGIGCVQIDLLVLGAHLDGVVTLPLDAVQGQVVFDRPALLALHLRIQRRCATDLHHGAVFGAVRCGVGDAVGQGQRGRVVERIFVGDHQFVVVTLAAVVPAQGVASVGVDHFAAGFRRGLAAELRLGFIAVLEGQLDAIVVGRLEVDLAEDQILLERLAGRAEAGGAFRGQQGGSAADRAVRRDGDRQVEALGFVGHEEVRLVLDDRATQCKTVFLLGRCLFALASLALGRGLGAHVFVGVTVEGFTLELVGTGLGGRGHGRARHLAVFGLVVAADDLVFTDRQLRERVAGTAGLAGHAAALDVALLAHAVDVDVGAVGVGGTAAQRGVALGITGEDQARDRVGEFQEVARHLRGGLDLLQADGLAHFGGTHFLQQGRCNDVDRVQVGGVGGAAVGRRAAEVQGRGGGHGDRHLLRLAIGHDVVGARVQAHQRVAAIGTGGGAAHGAAGHVGGGDFGAGGSLGDLAAQRRGGRLRHHARGGAQHQAGDQRAGQQTACGRAVAVIGIRHVTLRVVVAVFAAPVVLCGAFF